MAPVRQQIIELIAARLATIIKNATVTLGNGTTHTYGATVAGVYPWLKVPLRTSQLPALVVMDTTASVEIVEHNRAEHTLNVLIGIFVTESTSMSTVRQLLADIEACVDSDRRWSGKARYTELDHHTLDYHVSGDAISAAEYAIKITYRTAQGEM